ncbi:MAG: tetratricopeptide repeat protein [Candidatus Methanofastidiosa archaeon]|nr:tetratricopeptide repeat protein [Candidatus Methanofastidiosa archaeon]
MNDYNYRNLHKRAAEYYHAVRCDDEPQSIKDLETQLLEFEHHLQAENFDSATQLMNDIGGKYLALWGFLERVVDMRSKLLGKNIDKGLEIDNLLFLADTYRMMGKTDEAIKTGAKASELSQSILDKARMCKSFSALGGIYRRQGDYNNAIENLNQALELSRELEIIDVELQASLQLGQILYYINLVEDAVEILERALALSMNAKNLRMQGDLLGQLGYTSLWSGNFGKSLEYFKNALQIATTVNNKRGQGYWCLALGEIHMVSYEYDQAKQYFLSAIKIADDISDMHLKSYASSFLAESLLHSDRLEEALEVIGNARHLDNPQHNDYMAMIQGVVLVRMGKILEAKQVLAESLALGSKLLAKTPDFLEAKCSLGVTYLALAIVEQSDLSLFEYLNKSQEVLQSAFKDTVAAGVVQRFLNIINELKMVDKKGAVSLIVNSLGNTMSDNLDKTGLFIELHVPDFSSVIDFYAKLGFVVDFKSKEHGGYLTLRKRRCIINFYGGSSIIDQHIFFSRFPSSTPNGHRVEIIIPVDNIEVEYESAIKSLNASSIVEELQLQPWGKRDFRIVDPFGFYLRFTEKIDWLKA